MTTQPDEPDETSDDYTNVTLFVSATGKKHLAKTYSWGIGMACQDRFPIGSVQDGLGLDVDCLKCEKYL